MEWSWTAWAVTVAAVAVSGAVAGAEGHWRRKPGLDLGFAEHGGMWGDALLLSLVNGLVVPWIDGGWWLMIPAGIALVAAAGLHASWHGATRDGVRDHMWPTRPHARWAADLSWAGWCHVAYVIGQLALLLAYVVVSVPAPVVLAVSAILSAHVPIGLLQPSWLATGRVPRSNLRLLAAALAAVWVVAGVKAGLGL